MHTFTQPDIEKAIGVTSYDIANWSREGFIYFPFSNEGCGRGRKYNMLNVFEFALIKSFSALGIPLKESKDEAKKLQDVFKMHGLIILNYVENTSDCIEVSRKIVINAGLISKKLGVPNQGIYGFVSRRKK